MAGTFSSISVTSSPYFVMLLRLIKGHNDISFLTQKGITYSDIFHMLSEGETEGYLKRSMRTLILTEKGEELITKLPVSGMKSSGWIEGPSEDVFCEQISLTDVFLPTADDIKKFP
ncbi:hypothetical protein [Halodesulfovibrio sp.]|uniref:hypothetical protein n=1 Tax=Halodesulfovibrio sp. TaxID=1912772 RepID=UPI0025BFD3E4|nr:hypothetical protein [Halodesulfovibrio sp.]